MHNIANTNVTNHAVMRLTVGPILFSGLVSYLYKLLISLSPILIGLLVK